MNNLYDRIKYRGDRKSQFLTTKKGITVLLLTIVFLLFSSLCKIPETCAEVMMVKQIKDKTVAYPHQALFATFSGRVLSTSGKPVAQAGVEVNGKPTKTDVKGFFRITVQAKEQKAGNRFVLNIRKEGFGLLSKIYDSGIQDGVWILTEATTSVIDPARNNQIRDTRRPNICSGSLSSKVNWSNYEHRRIPRRVNSQGYYLGEASNEIKDAVRFAENANSCNGGVSLSVPANSLIDSQGNPPIGKVSVSLSTVDIYDANSMPGDYTVKLDSQTGYMVTYGAGTVSVFSRGKSYNLKKGARAILSIPVNSAQLKLTKNLPKNIPLLQYDEKQGIWRVIGEARLNAARDAYVGEIDHFSAFNMDLVKTDQACVRINSSAIAQDYELEITIPYEGDFIIKTVSVDNTPEKLHVIYNLPSNTDIALRAFRTVSGQVVPIMDTIMVNTGVPQNPSDPNCPVYPYSACNAEVAITETPLAPVLYGPSTSTGSITLSWDYTWRGFGSSQDGYDLEESTSSPNSGFSGIYTSVGSGDRRTHVEYTLTRSTGSYWYRVRANGISGYTPYSNVVYTSVQVACTTTPTPTTLRIINDLYNSTDAYGNDWNKLNGIIRVRIGRTCNDVITSTAGERLYPGESTTNWADKQLIYPAYLQSTNYRDFNVSNVTLASDGSYCVFIQNGWWDDIYDVNTFQYLYSEKKNSMVLNCNNACCIEKWATVPIVQPYCNPEVIRASDWLPHQHWGGHPSCP